MATTILRVGGMTCGACTSSIEAGFKGVEGIGSVAVSLVTEKAVVRHNPQKIFAERIQEIIDDRGFEAEVITTDIASPALRDTAIPLIMSIGRRQ
jgi:P-type Cu+ transporter